MKNPKKKIMEKYISLFFFLLQMIRRRWLHHSRHRYGSTLLCFVCCCWYCCCNANFVFKKVTHGPIRQHAHVFPTTFVFFFFWFLFFGVFSVFVVMIPCVLPARHGWTLIVYEIFIDSPLLSLGSNHPPRHPPTWVFFFFLEWLSLSHRLSIVLTHWIVLFLLIFPIFFLLFISTILRILIFNFILLSSRLTWQARFGGLAFVEESRNPRPARIRLQRRRARIRRDTTSRSRR